jgi:hypothetical protein
MLVAVDVWGWFGVDDRGGLRGGGLWNGGFGRVGVLTGLDRFQDTTRLVFTIYNLFVGLVGVS